MSARLPPDRRPTEVFPGVSIGGWSEALGFAGRKFCVLDEGETCPPGAQHLPVIDSRTGLPSVERLDRLVEAIHAALASGETVLVFCGHGVRRSPLVGAWFLHRTRSLSLPEAYLQIRKLRPQVEPVRFWARSWDPPA